MSAILLPFPYRRGKIVELDFSHDPKTGINLYIFEVIEHGEYVIIDVRFSLDEALDKIDWLRREGATIVEVGAPVEARS